MAKRAVAVGIGLLLVTTALVPMFAGASALAPLAPGAQPIPTSVLIATPSSVPPVSTPLAPGATPTGKIHGTPVVPRQVVFATYTPQPTAAPTNTPTVATAIPTPATRVSGAAGPQVGFALDSVRVESQRGIAEFSGERPAWSPDSSRLVFTKTKDWITTADNRGGWLRTDLWIADADGSNPHLIVSNGSQRVWSADGQWIYYTSLEARDLKQGQNNQDIYRVHPDGSGKTALYQGNAVVSVTGGLSSLVPLTGGRLAFVKDRREIGILSVESGSFLGSLPNADLSANPGGGFVVSPTERSLGCVTADGTLRLGPPDGSAFRDVAKVGYSGNLAWTPRGDRLAYSTGDALWVAEGDATHSRRVADLSTFGAPASSRFAVIGDPQWTPDGAILLVGYRPERQALQEVYAVEPATGRARQLLQGKGVLVVSPDGRRVALTEQVPATPAAARRQLITATLVP